MGRLRAACAARTGSDTNRHRGAGAGRSTAAFESPSGREVHSAADGVHLPPLVARAPPPRPPSAPGGGGGEGGGGRSGAAAAVHLLPTHADGHPSRSAPPVAAVGRQRCRSGCRGYAVGGGGERGSATASRRGPPRRPDPHRCRCAAAGITCAATEPNRADRHGAPRRGPARRLRPRPDCPPARDAGTTHAARPPDPALAPTSAPVCPPADPPADPPAGPSVFPPAPPPALPPAGLSVFPPAPLPPVCPSARPPDGVHHARSATPHLAHPRVEARGV